MDWGRFFRATRRADRVGIWWGILGPGGVLVTVFGSIVQAFEPIARYGWSAIVLSSVLLALATMLVGSAVLVAWRFFKPLPVDPSGPTSRAETAQNPNEKAEDLSSLLSRTVDVERVQATLRKELTTNNLKTFHLDREAEYLVHLAIDQIDIMTLQEILDNATETPYVDLKLDDEEEITKQTDVVRSFVKTASRMLSKARWPADAKRILDSAEVDASNIVAAQSDSERPVNVNPYKYREAAIAKLQCQEIIKFCESQKSELERELKHYRGWLADCMELRRANRNS